MDDSGLRWRLVGGNDPDIQGGSCHVFDSGGHTLIVDCGSRIGDDGRLWVPDIDTDLARASAIALTHGHPDHICGLASALARRVHCPPVYGTPLTLALFDDACNRLGVSASVRPVCHVLSSDGAVDLPGFRLSAYPVAHSLPQSLGFLMETKTGVRVLHSGDFTLDQSLPYGSGFDPERVKALAGGRGVDAMLVDTCVGDHPGSSGSFVDYFVDLAEYLARYAQKRIVIAIPSGYMVMFIGLLALARRLGRTPILTGSGDQRAWLALMVKAGLDLQEGVSWYAKPPAPQVLTAFDDPCPRLTAILNDPGSQLIVTDGLRVEKDSPLVMGASGTHPWLNITSSDVILLATCIPCGYAEKVAALKARLEARGAMVIDIEHPDYVPIASLSASHPFQEDIRYLADLTKPKTIFPIHAAPPAIAALEKALSGYPARFAGAADGDEWEINSEGAVYLDNRPALWIDEVGDER